MAKEKEKKKKGKKQQPQEESASKLDVCQKAPEWAEHERFADEDEPCDDSRGGPKE